MGWDLDVCQTNILTNFAPMIRNMIYISGILFDINRLYSIDAICFREKIDQFKKEVGGENANSMEKLSNENSKEVELSNEKNKDKSAAAC